jgi:alpha-L-arabinofuranosidase
VATCDATGRQVTLAVVNRDKERGHKARIQFAGGGAPSSVIVAEVNGAGPEVMHSFDCPDAVGVQEHRINLTGSQPDYLVPAHSITLLRFGFA